MRPPKTSFEPGYFFLLHVVLLDLDPVSAFVRPYGVVVRTNLELGLEYNGNYYKEQQKLISIGIFSKIKSNQSIIFCPSKKYLLLTITITT